MSVQTADITVSNLSLAWPNGTRISDKDTVKHNDTVKLSAKVTNVGTETANNFNVRFLVNDIQIRGGEGTKLSLAPNMTTDLFIFWNATVGHNVIKAEVDYATTIDETNETNNIIAKERYVCGAELSGNASWETRGLHGTMLFDPSQPYEEDEVNVSVNVTNTGCANAADFGVVLFFDYEPDIVHLERGHVKPKWLNKSYEGAISTYLKIDIQDYQILAIYDGNGNEVKRVDKSCWVHVMGDAASITYCIKKLVYTSNYTIAYYPIYAENLSRIPRLGINSSINIPLERNVTVSVGNYTVTAFIDPENHVPEDNKSDNIMSEVMQVLSVKDFTVLNVTVENTILSDMDTMNITAMVANVGFRNGTTDVRFVDYENETRTYKYYFDKIFPQSYLPIQPIAATLLTLENVPYEDLIIIHRPGVDGILLYLNKITLNQPRGGEEGYKLRGSIRVCDENVDSAWEWLYNGTYESPQTIPNQMIYVPGETAYIYTYNAHFEFGGYTTETRVHEENVTLNTSLYGPPKIITAPHWTASTGNHTIGVTIDAENRTAEINKSNNTFNLILSVNASRDAIIEDIAFNPQYPENGDNVTITAIVKNNGTKEANFTVDLWMNITKNSSLAHVSNASWVTGHRDENRTSYIILLNHTNVSLVPGTNESVNATWYNINISGDATHEVIAIVDPLDEIDELNESDNELRREIVMIYADFTVAGFISPSSGDKNASVSIENMGKKNETNVTVRFDVSKYSEIEETGSKTSWKSLTEEGAKNIRVHFEWLDARGNGWLEIRKNLTDEVPVKRYNGDVFKNEWSPWVDGDMIWLVYSLKKQRSFSVDAYEWGELENEIIDCINGSECKNVTIPSQWTNKYDEPQKLTATIDPDNEKNELVKANNSRTGLMYIDLKADNLTFVSPAESHLCVLAKNNIIRATIKNNNEIEGIVFSAGGDKRNFYVALEIRDLNGTVVYIHTGNSNAENSSVDFEFPYDDKTLYAGEEINVTFNIGDKIYPDFVGDTKNYQVSIIVDSEDDIIEWNDFYPRGEGNNETSKTVTVYHMSGYTGGDLVNAPSGKIYGDMIYSIGDSEYNSGDVSFNDIKSQISSNVTIKTARLYLHWLYWEKHDSASVDMQFNGKPVSSPVRKYYDDTMATRFPTRWGTYVYDVTEEVRDIVAHGGKYAASAQIYDDDAHSTGMGLLIVYEDESKPLIEYGIAEGTWTMMADNKKHPTGLLPEQCTANASFAGVVNTSKGKAELLTVLASWGVEELWTGTIGDALRFNGRDVGTPRGKSYWKYEGKNNSCMALTTNHWEDVTEYLSPTQNKAEIQSRGNFMMATNAFFKVTYLPDLTVTSLAVTPSSPRGGDTCKIKATIDNLGESKAENFVVRFNATDGTPSDEVRTIKLLEGNDNTTVDFTWTAPSKVGALDLIKIQDVTISVMADSGEKVEEFDEGNNIGSKDISVTMTDKPLKPPGGGGGGGSGGTGLGKEAVAEAPTTSGVRGEAAKSPETKGQTITGRLMKGIVAQSEAEGGGGERGEFSWVKLLIRLAILAVAIALVYVGYCHERRRHKNKQKK
jgi:subtilase family serine protease